MELKQTSPHLSNFQSMMSMSPTPKKRPKAVSKSPKRVLSTSSTIKMEPPPNLFPSKQELLRLVAVLAIASFVAMTCNFVANYINPTTKPFCDSNPESTDSLSDFCQPCPSNGECNQGKLECVHGYRRHGNICVEDGDVNERAKKLSEWIENSLCEAYADFLCHGTGMIWAQEDDILSDLDGHELMQTYESENPVNMYTKKRAMETISELLETSTNPHGKRVFKCPDLLGEHYKPFTCQLRQWICKNALVIILLCALVLGSAIIVWKARRRWYLSTRGEELYHQVCEILEENALMSKRGNTECEPWVVASWLRDHLLLPKERKDPVLWKKVEELVQEDSRVDRYPKLVKGESKAVWEWQAEGSLSSGRMRKKAEHKLKFSEGIKENSDKEHHALKPDTNVSAESEILMF